MLEAMRHLVLLVTVLLAACQPPPAERGAAPAKPDLTQSRDYQGRIAHLRSLNEKAETSLRAGAAKAAGEAVNEGLPLRAELLKVDRPPLEAAEAVSDLDDLYGRILMAKKQYGYARMQFQQNAARWRNWHPPSEEATRRLRLAETRMAECDRKMGLSK